MATLLPDDTLINTSGADLDWSQLAALQMRADAGDASAAAKLASMPKGAQYNAALITKAFKPAKPAKPPKAARRELRKQARAEAMLTKAEGSQGMVTRILERTMHTSENPADREYARLELDRMRGIL